MSPLVPILIILLSALALLFFVAVGFFTKVQPESIDLTFLRKQNMYALHILGMLESSDYRFYADQSRKYRDYLFLSYAHHLRQDMRELARLPLSGRALFYYLAFQLFYVLLVLKNRIYSSQNDLRALLGIELLLVRQLAR